ncbi:hypothetical protein QCA50_011403 [Cerrena zonata]|uniref:Uncharacterized protein n=1 Tax=Cerrena zonata TaxID=2478898 RepID=A0AAW0FXA8_9APHY
MNVMDSVQEIDLKRHNVNVGNALKKILTGAKTLASATVRLTNSSLLPTTRHARLVRKVSKVATGETIAIDEIEYLEA